MRRKNLFISVLMVTSLVFLIGCGNDSAENSFVENQAGDAEEEGAKEESEKEAGDEVDYSTPKELPQLPETGIRLADFVPEGWELLDSVELDFNEDGEVDYVGVLGAWSKDKDQDRAHYSCPRILFAIVSDGAAKYRLDFQECNLIYRGYGKKYGEDNNRPLTANGTCFTIHAVGGSGDWKWSRDSTYTYQKGIWWLTLSEETDREQDYITGYYRNDWESGVGIRKRGNAEFRDREKNSQEKNNDCASLEFDVEYELSLDDPLTLEQAGKRRYSARSQMTDWEVKEIVFAAGVELSENMVMYPYEDIPPDYCDENCELYVFNSDDLTFEGSWYLGMYGYQDRTLTVLAEEVFPIEEPKMYKGKIYYSVKSLKDDKEGTEEGKNLADYSINRIQPDGSRKETVFEYRYQETKQETEKRKTPYLITSYEISGDEIVVRVNVYEESQIFYRMKTDGSRQEKIGQIPK